MLLLYSPFFLSSFSLRLHRFNAVKCARANYVNQKIFEIGIDICPLMCYDNNAKRKGAKNDYCKTS